MAPRSLAIALALVLLPSSAFAEDLLQTYRLAHDNDPQYAGAEAGARAQKEGAVQARAQLLPQITGSASLTRDWYSIHGTTLDDEGNPINVPSTGEHDTTRSYGVNVNQSVFDWSRIANLRAQRALSRAADYDVLSAGSDLITRTSGAYFNVLVGIETLAAAQAAEVSLKKQFDSAQKRLEVGLAPITDVHEARAQYDSARANTIDQENALKDAYQALTEITGQPMHGLKSLPDDFQPQLPPEDGGIDGWVRTALANNPTLKSLEYQVQSANDNVSSARGGHYPTLDLSGSYGNSKSWSTLPSGTSSLNELQRSADARSLSLTLTVPIYAGGAVQSGVREALARRDQTQDSYEQQRRSVERTTRSAYNTLVAGITEIEARRSAVTSAQAAYDASQVGLEVGTRTVIDVLINQQNLLAAKQDYAFAKYQYLQNRLLLDQATGKIDIHSVEDVNRLLTADAEAQLKERTDAMTPSAPVTSPDAQ